MIAAELIRRGARQFASRVAVIGPDVQLTFAEVDDLANRAAAALSLPKGSPVGLLIGNEAYAPAIGMACTESGLVHVPLNTRLALPEHAEMLRITGARTLVHSAAQAERARALADGSGVQLVDVERDLLDAPAAGEPQVELHPDDTLILAFTSGTTGRLKAVRHTQRTYAAVVANILANLVDPRPGDVMLHAATVLTGFEPRQFLDAIPRWHVTHTNLVPTMLGALLRTPGVEDVDVSTLRTIVYGASPMPTPLLERALALWAPRLVQYYGQTEAPLCIAVLRPDDHHGERLLSRGQPAVDCEVRLDDETGEILLRAPFAAAGYHGDNELHRETFLPDGWVRTRDVGRFDGDGFLYVVDRTSDMIVTGGYNVYPREVEDALAAHPAVREAVAVAAPDETWVEAVTAFVVADGVSEEELVAHCRERLAGYKVPKTVRFVDEVPKSPVGKLLRRALRDPLWEGRDRPV